MLHCFWLRLEVVKSELYGEKADVWAAGCILYQMATLNPPFYSTNMLSLATKVFRFGRSSYQLFLHVFTRSVRIYVWSYICINCSLVWCVNEHKHLSLHELLFCYSNSKNCLEILMYYYLSDYHTFIIVFGDRSFRYVKFNKVL